jgi:hypothetical protein
MVVKADFSTAIYLFRRAPVSNASLLGALVIDFVRTPFRQFFTLRTEIRHEMLRLANVPAPEFPCQQ